MKNKLKRIIIFGIIIGLFIILYLLPPVAFCKGGIMRGKRTEYSETPANHIYTTEFMLSNPHYHKTSNFDYFYFFNFRFWEKLHISEIEYAEKKQQPKIKSFTPFIYIVEQNRKGEVLNSFYVNRGSHWWYFDYRYAPF